MNYKISAALAAAMLILAGCGSGEPAATTSGTSENKPSSETPDMTKPKPNGPVTKIAFVTNNVSDYWTAARKGVEKADKELEKYEIEFQMPSDGSAAEQKRVIDNLLSKGVKGLAVSPVDPKNQTEDLNAVSEKALVFTQDSDAPQSKRACYIGTDNVAAGRMAGEELKKALPDGGKIMVFVGKADAQNAKERYQGVQEALKGTKITIIDIRTDDTDRGRAKQNVADTIVKYPDIAGLVGLWSYNGPAILNAVKEANKVGKIKIVCFDDEGDTLAGIKDGAISATVVQQPFEFGYKSMMLMAKVLDGDKSGIPANKLIIVPTKAITKESVDEYSTNQKALLGKK